MKIVEVDRRVGLYETLDHSYKNTYELWESAGYVLKEFALDDTQIKQLFAQIEKDLSVDGKNRTAIGKGIDTATAAGKAVKKAYDELVDQVQNSAPMKNADAQYDQVVAQLKTATGGDQGVMKYVQKYRDFAKKHPVAQSFIYAALIAAAGISGAGLGGAAVLGLLKMTDRLLQGDKFSSALGKGAMTGATALAAGQVGQALQGADAVTPVQTDVPAPPPPGTDAVDAAAQTAVDAGKEGAKSAASTAATNRAGQVAADTATTVAQGAGVEMFPGLATDQMANDSIKRIADKIASGSLTQAEMNHLQATQSWIRAQITDAGYQSAPKEFWKFHDLLDQMTRAADNITVKESRARYIDKDSTVRHWALNESLGRKRGGVRLTEAGVRRIFEVAANEGVMDAIKGVAKKAGAAIAQTGKNITTKITADKLQSAWDKAGIPPDSVAIEQFLQQQGVDADTVAKSMQAIGLQASGVKLGQKIEPTMTGDTATAAATEPAPEPTPDYSGGQQQASAANAPKAALPAPDKEMATIAASLSQQEKDALIAQLQAMLPKAEPAPATESFRRLNRIIK
jgi:alkylhydroperoxidase/carboxymuconolactone decarboxylase family protein YurZ